MSCGNTEQNRLPMWRSLDERLETEEFREAVQREFSPGTHIWGDSESRRGFLQRMAASFALAGLSGCVRQPDESIVPYVEKSQTFVSGRALRFATCFDADAVLGLLVESHQGRPTKVEGNPEHPESLGATDAFAQASVLELYDPDRSQVVRARNAIQSRQAFFDDARPQLESHRRRKGAGLHLLTESITSPTLLAQLEEIHAALPEARWYVHDAVSRENIHRGTERVFGRRLEPRYKLDEADVIVAIDADFLATGPGHVRLAREFSRRRRLDPNAEAAMSRLYALETTPTLTGTAADHRLTLPPNELWAVLRGLARRLTGETSAEAAGTETKKWIDSMADDLQRAGSRSAVIAGPSVPPEMQALVHRLNRALQTVGTTVEYYESSAAMQWQPSALPELAAALGAGDVQTLLILGGNPAFSAPAELDFANLLAQAGQTWHHGLWFDETAALCDWHVPSTHFLESWGDLRAQDGTAAIMQPLIAPLYDGLPQHDLLNLLLDRSNQSAYSTVREYWRSHGPQDGFEQFWEQAVHDGVVPGSRQEPVDLASSTGATPEADSGPEEGQAAQPSAAAVDGFQIVFRPHPTVHDGRFANNGWLQELPQPLTKLTWGNPALISVEDAKRMEVRTGDVLRLTAGERSIEIPAWILPGQPPGVVTLHFGQGRTRAGRNGTHVGVNVYPLRTQTEPWIVPRVSVRKLDRNVALPTTQKHQLMEGRDLVRTGTLEEWKRDPQHPAFAHPEGHHVPLEEDGQPSSMYPDYEQAGPQWGMSINLGACTGCSACVVACQAENNIPIVGPEEVLNGREMHWLRIDTYYAGEPADPGVHHQPVMCMHCEHAPCEPVCPVAATTHSSEGLNEMTYNRCIGTRYCSNNCPYKVRRFNYFDYHAETRQLPVLHLLQNPNVSVRSRGVMEKCTYCVQRISAARIDAGMDNRAIRDGEVVTACQAACPTEAILFGNMADPSSRVAQEKQHPLTYSLLAELNTRPRTTYQASVRNPHRGLTEDS